MNQELDRRNREEWPHVAIVRTTRTANETVQAMIRGSSNASLVVLVDSFQSRGQAEMVEVAEVKVVVTEAEEVGVEEEADAVELGVDCCSARSFC